MRYLFSFGFLTLLNFDEPYVMTSCVTIRAFDHFSSAVVWLSPPQEQDTQLSAID